jgi:DNA processing protein
MEERKHWLALNMVVGVGKTLFHRLVRGFGSPKEVFRATPADLMRIEGIGEKTAAEISRFEVDRHAERELRLVEKYQALLLTLLDAEYPCMLKVIHDLLSVIYFKLNDLYEYPVPLAVVGIRQVTDYGRAIGESLAHGLAERGVAIVSGLARGINTIAHRAALKAGGSTVAVFGWGLAHTYPPENRRLRMAIEERGTVISEFPITMKPERNNFPARNRIISGLSPGTVVIEAGEKSGALITAEFALEQGREVFAVPGRVNSPASAGPHRLIQNGAKLVTGPESVIEELPQAARANLTQPSETKGLDTAALTPVERRVVALLSAEERHIDEVTQNS